MRTEAGTKPKRDRGLLVLGVFAVLLIGGATALLVYMLGAEVPTRGPSMRPTLGANESIEIDPDAYVGESPEIGDIVTLQGPENFRTQACGVTHPRQSPCPVADDGYEAIRLIKRVVGLAGDRIAFTSQGGVIRNGERVDEPYILKCSAGCALPVAITVPEGHVFVVGDNRARSSDSRIWGAVPAEAIDGQVVLDD